MQHTPNQVALHGRKMDQDYLFFSSLHERHRMHSRKSMELVSSWVTSIKTRVTDVKWIYCVAKDFLCCGYLSIWVKTEALLEFLCKISVRMLPHCQLPWTSERKEALHLCGGRSFQTWNFGTWKENEQFTFGYTSGHLILFLPSIRFTPMNGLLS